MFPSDSGRSIKKVKSYVDDVVVLVVVLIFLQEGAGALWPVHMIRKMTR